MTNVWAKYISNNMIHEIQGPMEPFKLVSFDCELSANGLASLAVNVSQVSPCTDDDGTEVKDRKNILLGDKGTKRKIMILKEDGTLEGIEMTVEEIATRLSAGRKA